MSTSPNIRSLIIPHQDVTLYAARQGKDEALVLSSIQQKYECYLSSCQAVCIQEVCGIVAYNIGLCQFVLVLMSSHVTVQQHSKTKE